MTASARPASPFGDLVAIGLSAACLAHCLALPLAAAFLPALGLWAQAEWVHWAFVALAAPISVWALAWPPRGGLRPTTAALALAGIAALTAGAAHWPPQAPEGAITVAGSLLIAAAHVLNLRRRRHRHVQKV